MATLLLAEAAEYLGDAMRRRAAATFQVYYWPLDLAQLLLLALLGFLLAAPGPPGPPILTPRLTTAYASFIGTRTPRSRATTAARS